MTTDTARQGKRNMIGLGAHVGGVVKTVQVVESRRLHMMRRRLFARHGNPDAFRNLHGRQFGGRFGEFMALSLVTRSLIERDLARDIQEHAYEWEESQRNEVVEVVEERPAKANLVLTSGIDQILNMTGNPAQVSSYCAVGTGTTTPSAGQTGLVAEVRRSNSYLIGTGNCGTTYSTGTNTAIWTFRRTYDQAIESSSQNYSEIGWSPSAAAGANLFSRTLISGGTVTVTVGQSLRSVYDLTFTVNTSAGSGSLNMDEWGSVSAGWSLINANMPTVDTNGGAFMATRTLLSPFAGNYTYSNCFAIPVTGDFSYGYEVLSGHTALASAIVTNDGPNNWSTYTPGSGSRSLTWPTYFNAASFESTAIRGFLYQMYGPSLGSYNAFAIKFGANQTKTNLQRLYVNGITVSYTA